MLKFSMVYEFTVPMSENIKGETKLNLSTFKSILYFYTYVKLFLYPFQIQNLASADCDKCSFGHSLGCPQCYFYHSTKLLMQFLSNWDPKTVDGRLQ